VKETGPASTLKIHDPSIGAAMPPVFCCKSVCAMAFEFKIGTAGARIVKVLSKLTALRVDVMFRLVVMSLSFECEIKAASA
jgi:hypothetical protein